MKDLSFYEKAGVIESIDSWQLCRATRNLAAHDYEIDCVEIAEHFNAVHALTPQLYETSARFLAYCDQALNIQPVCNDFSEDFRAIAGV